MTGFSWSYQPSNTYVGVRQSDLMPSIPQSFDIRDLFANLQLNWTTLMPVLALLFGILFATYLVRKVIQKVRGEDD